MFFKRKQKEHHAKNDTTKKIKLSIHIHIHAPVAENHVQDNRKPCDDPSSEVFWNKMCGDNNPDSLPDKAKASISQSLVSIDDKSEMSPGRNQTSYWESKQSWKEILKKI